MNALQILVAFLGRVCLSLIFILAALSKFFNWQATEQLLTTNLNDFMIYQGTHETVKLIVEPALQWVPALTVIGVVVELLGGLLLFLGIRVRFGAFILLIFLVCTTVVFHHFWLLQGSDKELQLTMFLKNIAIFGGLLGVLAFGKGPKTAKKVESSSPKAAE